MSRLIIIVAFFIRDDFGTQQASFLSPRLFNKFFKGPYRKLIDITHDLGMDFIFHSCGDVSDLLPEFIKIGVDAFEFDSPKRTGLETMMNNSRQNGVAFCLSSDIQSTFVLGTPLEVESEIKQYIEKVGSEEGGLVIWEYTTTSALRAPKENILTPRQATIKWGM